MIRILLIEDNLDFRQVLSTSLRQAGHEVCEAKNGIEGLEQLCRHTPDIVITDIVMDRKDGLETLMEMRKRFPTVPAIAISGSSRHSHLYLKTAQHLGAVYSLEKPFTIEKLLALLDDIFPERRERKA